MATSINFPDNPTIGETYTYSGTTYIWNGVTWNIQEVISGLPVSVIAVNTTAVAFNIYVFTASLTLTLPASATAGDSIKVSDLSNTITSVIARNGHNIMGSATDLTLDVAYAGIELIYTGVTQGWVIIGIN
tara:strand:+ start:2860 stop:3252 length:393 start_codon:yes stop_codon:yes gene_type:complete